MSAERSFQYQQAIQQALVEHLIETGLMDAEAFKETVIKWQHNMGLDPLEDPLNFLEKKPSTVVAEPSSASPSSGKPKMTMKILLVDDVKFIRDLIRNTLVNDGYSIFFEAENGYEAMEVFRREKPDIIISDIEMKGMSGLEVLREIRKVDPITPVIIMTGNPTENYVKVAVECGMTDFIAKPLDVNRLLDVIHKRLGH